MNKVENNTQTAPAAKCFRFTVSGIVIYRSRLGCFIVQVGYLSFALTKLVLSNMVLN